MNVVSWRHAYRGIVDPAYLHNMDIDTYAVRWRDRLDRDAETDVVFVAENPSAELAAYCVVRCNAGDREETGLFLALYVDPAVWGRGAGGAVHHAGIDHLAALGCGSAVLWVAQGNERARAFSVRRGWIHERHGRSGHDLYRVADTATPVPIVRYRRSLVG